MAKRRETEIFSLSFLDCICCGFGAIILLFILTMGRAKTVEKVSMSELQKMQTILMTEFQAEVDENVRLTAADEAKTRTLRDLITEVATLKTLLAKLRQQVQNETSGNEALTVDNEQLKREIAAMQIDIPDIPQIDATTPIGIPVESNYVAFVIDTSGSMRDPNTEMLWSYVVKKFDEVLTAYPQVKGVQFLDADGRFIFGRNAGWIPDSRETRQSVLETVRRYQIFSNSNPVPGIVRAIRTLHDPTIPDMKMGIYVFGDEFTDTSEQVLERIDRMNPPGPNGKRPITINGVGFPNLLRSGFSLGQSGVKFANLMRELTQQHGGAFVAVTE